MTEDFIVLEDGVAHCDNCGKNNLLDRLWYDKKWGGVHDLKFCNKKCLDEFWEEMERQLR